MDSGNVIDCLIRVFDSIGLHAIEEIVPVVDSSEGMLVALEQKRFFNRDL